MSAKFTISGELQTFPHIEKIAVGLAIFHNTGNYPSFLGHYGQLERNPLAMQSNIHKIHIALYQNDFDLETWQNRNGAYRTCDNMVVYTQHFFQDEYFQILGIITPNAHARLDKLITDLIEQAEKFHSLRPTDLLKIKYFSAENIEITQQIVLTK